MGLRSCRCVAWLGRLGWVDRRHVLRLLWINHFAVTPGQGGGTRHFELGQQLAGRGWAVQIAASDFHLHQRSYTRRADASDRRLITERVDDVEFAWLWSAPYQNNDWRRARNWITFARSLTRLTPGDERPDLVIGSTPHLFAAAAGARLAARWGVPFLLEVRDLWPESMVAAGGRKGPVYMVLDLLAQWLYRRADRIITLAEGTGAYLREERGVEARKLVYIPNGVDTEAFPDRDRSPENVFIVAYTGAHGPANGLDAVVEAARILSGERPEIRFRLMGDGPAKEALIRRVERLGVSNVEFRDPVPKSEIPMVLSEAHAGLMVLRDTPLFAFGVSPNKLFDYMAARLPIVCNVAGAVRRMVSEADAGELAEPGSSRSLADAVIRLADRSESERRAMGMSAREWVTREHGRPVLAKRLDEALRDVLVR